MDIENILTYIKQSYTIDKKITDYIYRIKYQESFYILNILHPKSIEWSRLDSYDVMNGYEYMASRIIGNHRLCDHLKIGPKLYQSFRINGVIVLITEYLPYDLNDKYIADNEAVFKKFISNLHSKGIYHGDLHGGNIRLDKNGQIKIIDLETMFYSDEIQGSKILNPLIKEWIEQGFDIDDIQEYIQSELNENWKYVVDD